MYTSHRTHFNIIALSNSTTKYFISPRNVLRGKRTEYNISARSTCTRPSVVELKNASFYINLFRLDTRFTCLFLHACANKQISARCILKIYCALPILMCYVITYTVLVLDGFVCKPHPIDSHFTTYCILIIIHILHEIIP